MVLFLHSRTRGRGQTSIETLLVIAFILTLTTLISISFFENQTKTTVATNIKLLLLPYLEKNSTPLYIATISPMASSGAPAQMHLSVSTRGELDSTFTSLFSCDSICSRIDPSDYFPGGVTFTWVNRSDAATTTVCDVVAPC